MLLSPPKRLWLEFSYEQQVGEVCQVLSYTLMGRIALLLLKELG